MNLIIKQCEKLNLSNKDGNSIDYRQFFDKYQNNESDISINNDIPPFNGFIAIHNEIIGYNQEDIDRLSQFQSHLLELTKLCIKYQKNTELMAAQNSRSTNEWNLPNCQIL